MYTTRKLPSIRVENNLSPSTRSVPFKIGSSIDLASVSTSTTFGFPKTSSKFYYYGYSKIVLPQLHTKCIFHDLFLCLVFLIDLLTYSYYKNSHKMLVFQIVTISSLSLLSTLRNPWSIIQLKS